MSTVRELSDLFEDIEHQYKQAIEDTKHITHHDAALAMAGYQRGLSESMSLIRVRLEALLSESN